MTATAFRRPFSPPSPHALPGLPLFRALLCPAPGCGFPTVRALDGKRFCARCDGMDELLSTPWASFRPDYLDDGEGPSVVSTSNTGGVA